MGLRAAFLSVQDSCPGSCRGSQVGPPPSGSMPCPAQGPGRGCQWEWKWSQLTEPFPAGYGQDLAGFGQGFSDPSQQPPSYGGPSVPGSGGPPAGGSGFGRGQNHNVQGFHPYRR